MKAPLLFAGLLIVGLACRSAKTHEDVAPVFDGPVPAPLILEGKAYDRAGAEQLPEVAAVELPGLHNVFDLSDSIISGGEPQGQAGLESLAAMGVRTIVTVDGKVPAAKEAAALGMRYVHIPIQYKGITPDEMDRLAKTFRELDAPFYVHCFHGKHRGPAGAAVGRVVRDGADRGEAISEMRQYSGTSKKYEGLYRSIAARSIPTQDETHAFAYDFPAVQLPEGIVGAMVPASRTHDFLVELEENGWKPDPMNPDVDALNEAQKLHEAFALGAGIDEVLSKPKDFRGWWKDSVDHSAGLVDALQRFNAGNAKAAKEASLHFAAVRDACSSCHGGYRNED